jgi:putative flavoprotein involved in K+ transport
MSEINTIVVGGGQAGLAISEHLNLNKIPHIIFEKDRLVENWRTGRWDSLVANGPAWHDRFPSLEFKSDPDSFVHKDIVVSYFEEFAKKINAPIKTNVKVEEVIKENNLYKVTTSESIYYAKNIVVATGAFQKPIIPKIIPESSELNQIHSKEYRNPDQLREGGVLVVGSGSSGSQIAQELLKANKNVYLSIGPHNRPPRSYRGKDNVWWFGALGVWQKKTPDPNTQHVTIAVSGYDGGKTIDFRNFAEKGMKLVGMTKKYDDGILYFENDLKINLNKGDKDYLSVLESADKYIEKNNLDFPKEEKAKIITKDPDCVLNPILELNLNDKNISNIIWATGYAYDFSWLKVDTFDENGKPIHQRGVSKEKGIYFLGLPWLSMRGSSFIWGVWQDAKYLGKYIQDYNDKLENNNLAN